MTFKYVLKAIAQKHGLHATFMPKPLEGINGSGMHVHQSFGFARTGKERLRRRGRPLRALEDRQALHRRPAHTTPAACAGCIAPLVNSYRRLVPGYEAPVYVSWARTNRSALIRVPAIRGGHTAATRIELRCPDPSCNPYLAFAVMLAAGIDGIERELPLPEPVEENLYHFTDEDLKRRNIPTLPATLGEAVDEMRHRKEGQFLHRRRHAGRRRQDHRALGRRDTARPDATARCRPSARRSGMTTPIPSSLGNGGKGREQAGCRLPGAGRSFLPKEWRLDRRTVPIQIVR